MVVERWELLYKRSLEDCLETCWSNGKPWRAMLSRTDGVERSVWWSKSAAHSYSTPSYKDLGVPLPSKAR